jgi:peptide/nickel transport system ATP-binding protein
MYLGSLVEKADKKEIFKNPMHPYTRALLSAVPIPNPDIKMNRTILEGDIPSPANPPSGCKFHTRCPKCMEVCKTQAPKFKEYENGHMVACHLYSQK